MKMSQDKVIVLRLQEFNTCKLPNQPLHTSECELCYVVPKIAITCLSFILGKGIPTCNGKCTHNIRMSIRSCLWANN